MYGNPAPVAKIASLKQTPVPGTDLDARVEGIAYALGLNQFFLGSLVPSGGRPATLPASVSGYVYRDTFVTNGVRQPESGEPRLRCRR